MGSQTCAICASQSRLGALEMHHIVPTEITEQADMPYSETIELCSSCHQELLAWYSTRVTHVTYDPAIKMFKNIPPAEIARAYQAAFETFVKHKREQGKLTGSSLTDRQNEP